MDFGSRRRTSGDEADWEERNPESRFGIAGDGIPSSGTTRIPGECFVAGDAATGASLVVKCIAGGRKAAADIDAYLSRK